jgi:hypothetical protein
MNEPMKGSAGTLKSSGFFVFTAGHFPTGDASITVAALVKRYLRRSFVMFDSLNMLFVALNWDVKADALTAGIILDYARIRGKP